MGCEWLLEAAVIAERVVEVWTEAVGTKPLRTLVAIQTLAATYQKQGREGEANHLEAQVEELRRDVDSGFEREKKKGARSARRHSVGASGRLSDSLQGRSNSAYNASDAIIYIWDEARYSPSQT
jgi:hypothetical protein